MALQPDDKEDLLARLGSSLDAAAGHLAWVLGLEPEAPGARKFPDLFRRHELARDGPSMSWPEGCRHNVAETQDSVEFCTIRKLQALGGLCDEGRNFSAGVRQGLKAALGALEERQENIPGLDIRRDPLPERVDAEAFVYEQERVGSGQKVLSPALHTTAMMALLRCHKALGKTVKAGTQLQWVMAADQAVAQVAPAFKKLSHHMLGVVWEALASFQAQLPAAQTSAAAKVGKVLAVVERAMRKQFKKGASQGVWSYSGAAAVALRASHAGLGAAEKERFAEQAAEHASRFRDSLLPGMNSTQLCTCGPVSGLAPLATFLQDARLAMLVLELVTKDIELFQVPPGEDSAPGAEAGLLAGAPEASRFAGAFLRSTAQLEMEGRPKTMRIDDTATCFASVAAALRMVEAMPAVEAPPSAGTPDSLPADGEAAADEAPHGAEL